MAIYIVFDVDGTLADTEESVLSSLDQIVQEETGKTRMTGLREPVPRFCIKCARGDFSI